MRGRAKYSWERGACILGVLLAAAACAVACDAPAGPSGEPVGYVNGRPGSVSAFVDCMRTHGVPGFPGPDAAGQISLAGINRNAPKVVYAFAACGATQQSTAADQQARNIVRGLRFARCMRAHGVTNFPDPNPGANPGGQHSFHASGQGGSALVARRAVTACRPLLAGQNPGGG